MKTWASVYYRISTVQGIVGVNLQNSRLMEEWSHNLMCKVKNQLCQDSGMNQERSVLSPRNHLGHRKERLFHFLLSVFLSLPLSCLFQCLINSLLPRPSPFRRPWRPQCWRERPLAARRGCLDERMGQESHRPCWLTQLRKLRKLKKNFLRIIFLLI